MQHQSKTTLLKIIFIASFLQFLVIPVSFGQGKASEIEKLVDLYTQYGKFNGSVLVAKYGEVVYKDGHGLANMEWNIPNAANTKHRLGSITKQFTATLILQLVAEGTLQLDAPITTYLPNYPVSNGNKITLHHLLTHTAGIPNYTSFPRFFEEVSRNPYEPEEFVKKFADSILQFTPGEKFAYSNSGYFLLGLIIEKVTGKTYEQNLKDKIFTPAKMANTGFDHHKEIIKNRASGYGKEGTTYVNAAYLDMSIPYAAGSMYATVEDLYLWDQALYGEQILPEKYKDIMFKKYIPANGDHYAYGWVIGKMPIGNTTDSLKTIGHGGGINGFNTLITRIPSDKSLIVLLNNTGGAPLDEMTKAISAILYDKPYDMPKRSLATRMMEIITENGLEPALKFFKKNKEAKDYELKENEMNRIGYQLLRSDKIDEALTVFKINTEEFPKSSNVYDSYGEALLEKGDTENAIKNYRKSVVLNPGNQNGIDALKKMGNDVSDLIKEVVVDDTILNSYVGRFELMPEFIITITKEENQLNAQATGQPKLKIFPKSDNVFYLKEVAAQLTFNKNEKNEVESVTLNQNGREMTGKKIE